jgi:hypothetical protein
MSPAPAEPVVIGHPSAEPRPLFGFIGRAVGRWFGGTHGRRVGSAGAVGDSETTSVTRWFGGSGRSATQAWLGDSETQAGSVAGSVGGAGTGRGEPSGRACGQARRDRPGTRVGSRRGGAGRPDGGDTVERAKRSSGSGGLAVAGWTGQAHGKRAERAVDLAKRGKQVKPRTRGETRVNLLTD